MAKLSKMRMLDVNKRENDLTRHILYFNWCKDIMPKRLLMIKYCLSLCVLVFLFGQITAQNYVITLRGVDKKGVETGRGAGLLLSDGTLISHRLALGDAKNAEIKTINGSGYQISSITSYDTYSGLFKAVVAIPDSIMEKITKAKPSEGSLNSVSTISFFNPRAELDKGAVAVKKVYSFENFGELASLEGRFATFMAGAPLLDATGNWLGIFVGGPSALAVSTERLAAASPIGMPLDDFTDKYTFQSSYVLALQAFADSNFRDAFGLAKRSIEEGMDDNTMHLIAGRSAMKGRNYQAAAEYFEKYRETQKDKEDYARALIETKQSQKAISAIDEAVEGSRVGDRLLLAKGNILLELKDTVNALSAYEAALAKNGNNQDLHFQVGKLHLEREEWQKAYSSFLKAKELGHQDPLLAFGLGTSLFNLNRIDEAIPFLSEAISTDSRNAKALELRGMAYYQQEEWAKSEEDLGYAVRLLPPSTDALYALAYSAYQNESYPASYAALSRAEEQGLKTAEVFKLKGDLLMQRRDYAGAIASYSTALEKGISVTPSMHTNLAKAYYAQRDYSNAAKYFEQAGEENLTSQEAKEAYAVSLVATGQKEKAYPLLVSLKDVLEDEMLLAELGLMEFSKGKYEDCIASLTKALEKGAQDPRIFEYRGFANFELKQHEQAAEDLERASRAGRDSSEVYYQLGQSFYYLKNYSKAAQALVKAEEKGISEPTLFAFAGHSFYEEKKANQAKDYLNRAYDAGIKTPTVVTYLGLSHYRTNDYEQAVPKLEEATQQAVENPEVYFALGESLIKTGNFEKAIPALEKAQAKGYDGKQLFALKGKAYYELEQYDRAIQSLTEVLKQERVPSMLLIRGKSNFRIGNLDAALADLDAVKGEATMDAEGFFMMGDIFFDKKNWKQADFYFTKAQSKGSKSPELFGMRGLARFNLKDLPKAIADLRIAVGDEKQKSLYEQLGIAEYKMKHYGEAAEALKKGLEVKPNDQNMLILLGSSHTKNNNYPEAIGVLSRAISVAPADSLYFWRGLSYQNTDKNEPAISDLNKAAELGFSDPILFLTRGKAKEALDNTEGAIEDYLKAIDKGMKEPGLYNHLGELQQSFEKHKDAIFSFTKAIELDPNLAVAYKNRVRSYIISFSYREALDDIAFILSKNSKDPDALFYKGQVQLAQFEYDNAILNLQKSISAGIRNPKVFFFLGRAFYEVGEFEKALLEFSNAIAKGYDASETFAERGKTEYQMGKYKKALADLQTAKDKGNTEKETMVFLGKTYSKLDQFKDAIGIFDDLIKQFSNDAELYVFRGTAYKKAGKHTEAITNYNTAENKNIKTVELYANRGESHYYKNNYDKSLQDAEAALALSDSSELANYVAGAALFRKGNLEEAFAFLDKAIFLNDTFSKAYAIRGLAEFEKKEYNQTVLDLDYATEHGYKSLEVFNTRAKALYELEDYTAVVEDMNVVLEKFPDDTTALFYRGKAHTFLENYTEALIDLEKLTSLLPDQASAHRAKGDVEYYSGAYDESIESYSRAVALEPNDFRNYFYRALSKIEKGDIQGALEDYNKAIRLDPENATLYYNRGSVKYSQETPDLNGACEDWLKAEELGDVSAKTMLKQYCR